MSYDEDSYGCCRYLCKSDITLLRVFDTGGKFPLWDHKEWFTQMSDRQHTHHVRRRVLRVVAYINEECERQILEAHDGPLTFMYERGKRGRSDAICGVFCGPEVCADKALTVCVEEAVASGAFVCLDTS
jgi:hypothetical protein